MKLKLFAITLILIWFALGSNAQSNRRTLRGHGTVIEDSIGEMKRQRMIPTIWKIHISSLCLLQKLFIIFPYKSNSVVCNRQHLLCKEE